MVDKISDSVFPMDEIDIVRCIKDMWQQGWFDSYSDEHFLIRAIRGQISKIEWETQLVSNNQLSLYTPINSGGSINYTLFLENFIVNLSSRLMCLCNTFGKEKIRKFVEDQLSAGKKKYDENQFFQALSEIEILSFYAARTNWDKAIYEPPIGKNGSNPEAQFEKVIDSTTFTVNVEVKTPQFPKYDEGNAHVIIPTILLTDEGRSEIEELSKRNNAKCIMPRVDKLIELINSACKKFRIPQKNEYNLLYINWSYSDYPLNGFLEAWSLLTNEKNGILTHPEIREKLHLRTPLCKDANEKITAVIVYTSSLEQLMFSSFQYAWQRTPEVGSRFRMFVLDEKLHDAELKGESTSLFKITGMKPNIPEPQKWGLLYNYSYTPNASLHELTRVSKFYSDAIAIIKSNILDVSDHNKSD